MSLEKLVNICSFKTSLNTHGNPIVNSADDAIELFKTTNLDAIILGDKLIEKILIVAEKFLFLVLIVILVKYFQSIKKKL